MSIVLENLTKRYENQTVVNNVSLEIADGEFFVLLGSSGSGKTTILNVIAGLTGLDQGRVLLHGRDVTFLPTRERRVGFVFQNYALFQHMTVADNVEFALSIRKTPRPERRRRRAAMLDLVGLAGLGDRLPGQLSGGQQQRVALARALAHEPDVLLLDEPLGALDARIRVGLRRSLHEIQRTLGVATILVTHDQEEAFDLADRIGVMSYGRLVEVGRPADLYQRPQTEFVATFLGAANLLIGRTAPGGFQLGSLTLGASDESLTPSVGEDGPDGGQRVQLLIRPEDIMLAPDWESLRCPALGVGEVESMAFGGSFERLRLRLPPIEGVRTIAPAAAYGGKHLLIEATRQPEFAREYPLREGDMVWVGVRRFHALDHPGLSFLIVADGSKQAEAALDLGGQMARLAHARVTLLGLGDRYRDPQVLEEIRKQLGSGPAAVDTLTSTGSPDQAIAEAAEQEPHDLVILGRDPERSSSTIWEAFRSGEHHLLLVPGPQPVPTRALICVAGGEPGKADVLFTGRLARHLGTEATLMTIVGDDSPDDWKRARTNRFLDAGVLSLNNLGVPARALIRKGNPQQAIVEEFNAGGYDLLVLGAPLADRRGEIPSDNLVTRLIEDLPVSPILIVRSTYTGRIHPAAGPVKMGQPDITGLRRPGQSLRFNQSEAIK